MGYCCYGQFTFKVDESGLVSREMGGRIINEQTRPKRGKRGIVKVRESGIKCAK